MRARNRALFSLVISVGISLIFFLFPSPIRAADTTAPLTVHSFSGVLGNNNWYTSSVDVTLRASDLESGPKSTTYWLDSNSPTTKNHTAGQNQIANPSFENGWLIFINNWEHNSGAFFWQDFVYHKFGWRSAAIGEVNSGGQFYYWHNRTNYVPTVAGETYAVSAWVKTIDINGLGAWFEIWGRASTPSNDQLIASSDQVSGTADWSLLQKSFTMPSGFSGVYLKLGVRDEGLAGVAFWDGVSLYSGYSALTEFTVVENGSHLLHYYSEDNAGNVEGEKSADLKIDTVAPADWENFQYLPGSNDHSYVTEIEVADPTSGVEVASASYRWYTDHLDQGWSKTSEETWDPVDRLEVVSTGQPATDGETSKVRLITPEIDFGSSATVMRVQFRITDRAGNTSDSPIMTIEGAWFQISDGGLYVKGDISLTASPPSGSNNTPAEAASGGNISNLVAANNWLLSNYNHRFNSATTAADIFSAYESLKSQAQPLPGSKLPTSNGIYLYNGDYVIDHNSTPSQFEGDQLSAVIFIEGNLTISQGYSLNPASAVMFIVSSDVRVAGQVEEINGFFLVSGEFDTNYNNQGNKQLTIKGGVTALNGIRLGRDLGRKGNPSNGEAAAEVFALPWSYFFNSQFVQLVESERDASYSWLEIPPP